MREIFFVRQNADGVQAAGGFATVLDIGGIVFLFRAARSSGGPGRSYWSCRSSRSWGSAGAASHPTSRRPFHSVAGLLPSTGLVQSKLVSRRGMKLPWK